MMPVNKWVGILSWAAAALMLAAACVPVEEPLATATLIVFPNTATASPRPATATTAPTGTEPASPTPVPSNTAIATATASATVARPTETAAAATQAATATAATEGAATATSSPVATSSDFTPTAQAVWDMPSPPNPGPDVTSGDCSGSATPAYGLVLITPQGDTLVWRPQEPAPYTFNRAGENTWQYSGPTAAGDGSVNMTLKFTSATTFDLTHVFVHSNEPNCTHTHQMTGIFRNYR